MTDPLAAAEAALAAAEAKIAERSRRLLDAVRAAGQARSDFAVIEREAEWLRGLVEAGRDTEAKLRAQIAWLEQQLTGVREERSAQLLARAEEAAWLHSRVADSEVRAANLQHAADQAASRVRALEAERARSWKHIARRLIRPLLGAQSPRQPSPPAAGSGPTEPDPPSPEPPPARLPAREPSATNPPADPLADPQAAPELPRLSLRPRRPAASSAPGRAVHAVHQFHAGSATGDAITNAMIMIRSLLRRSGFDSEIYVAHRGEGLGADIRLLEELPPHDGYVLLLHHSIGAEQLDGILDLPARKVLVYHNITPPELLANRPRIAGLARLGREQLDDLRDQVSGALADSDFNAVELRAAGFNRVAVAPLLFDLAEIQRRAEAPRLAGGAFTVLFVGRVTPSKAQDDLIDAFAVFQPRLGRPSRLVLAGALDPAEHAYLDALGRRIAAGGLEDAVQLTGQVPDDELWGWYRKADLYVSLSRHEGFGVPLIEAMAHGVPVLAWPSGAVAETVGDGGTLLASREPEAVADAMLALAAHPAEARARGLAALNRFALDRTVPALMQALADAGAVPRPAALARDLAPGLAQARETASSQMLP